MLRDIDMTEESLQERYAPRSVCFGCGPANKDGLRIRSLPRGGEVVCEWAPEPHHSAFEGFLSGGIAGTILDCHCNWTAAYALMKRGGRKVLPPTVTVEFTIAFQRPTPITVLDLRAKAVEIGERSAMVEATLEVGGRPTVAFRGRFAEVREGHPAYNRWR